MSERQELVQAIVKLESQRELFGDAVVETALWVLRDKLARLPATAVAATQETAQQLTVLVADLCDFTAWAAQMDAEEVRDLVNAIWRELDGVITAWGGEVDKVVGDGLIAHFGLPTPRHDDAVRTIRAALEMQTTLAWLQRSRERHLQADMQLGMRIGIHTGPVLLGRLGRDGGLSAVGDTVRIAELLERAAPAGGVLISEEVYRLVHGRFAVQPVSPVAIGKKQAVMPALRVDSGLTRPWQEPAPPMSDLTTHSVGRLAELERLQNELQDVVDSNTPQVLIVSGADGIGKSRLLADFAHWLESFPAEVEILRAGVLPSDRQRPFAPLRRLVTTYLACDTRYNAAVARAELVQALTDRLAPLGLPTATAGHTAAAIGQLIGYDFAVELGLDAGQVMSPALYDEAFSGIQQLLADQTGRAAALVILLEDIDDAASGLLEFLEQLLEGLHAIPLLLVATARPTIWAQRPIWSDWVDDPFHTFERLELEPLSAIDSRHFVGALLHKAPQVPLRLVDLVVTLGEGSPLGIEEALKYFIDAGVIQTGDSHWQIRMGRLPRLRLPAGLRGLWQLRLQQLDAAERLVLQRAAVCGRAFFDQMVQQMGHAVAPKMSRIELAEILARLEQKGLVYLHPLALGPTDREHNGARRYLFRHASWQRVAYASLTPEERRVYHREAAHWLVAHAAGMASAPLIAEHFRLAEEPQQAALWAQRGGS